MKSRLTKNGQLIQTVYLLNHDTLEPETEFNTFEEVVEHTGLSIASILSYLNPNFRPHKNFWFWKEGDSKARFKEVEFKQSCTWKVKRIKRNLNTDIDIGLSTTQLKRIERVDELLKLYRCPEIWDSMGTGERLGNDFKYIHNLIEADKEIQVLTTGQYDEERWNGALAAYEKRVEEKRKSSR